MKKRSPKAGPRATSRPDERGSTLLLSGPDAANASATARAIAAGIGKKVRRTSLAKVVGKYAGETERNLARLLARATELDIVLVLDEADALFGRRTAVRAASQRYAHMQMNHLLRMIEDYGGVAIVTASSDGALDPVFVSRFGRIDGSGGTPKRTGAKVASRSAAKLPIKAALKAPVKAPAKSPNPLAAKTQRSAAARSRTRPARKAAPAPRPKAKRATAATRGNARGSARRR